MPILWGVGRVSLQQAAALLHYSVQEGRPEQTEKGRTGRGQSKTAALPLPGMWRGVRAVWCSPCFLLSGVFEEGKTLGHTKGADFQARTYG